MWPFTEVKVESQTGIFFVNLLSGSILLLQLNLFGAVFNECGSLFVAFGAGPSSWFVRLAKTLCKQSKTEKRQPTRIEKFETCESVLFERGIRPRVCWLEDNMVLDSRTHFSIQGFKFGRWVYRDGAEKMRNGNHSKRLTAWVVKTPGTILKRF